MSLPSENQFSFYTPGIDYTWCANHVIFLVRAAESALNNNVLHGESAEVPHKRGLGNIPEVKAFLRQG